MDTLDIYSVSDRYISFLRNDDRLKNVFDNKENQVVHSRKYLGVVLTKNNMNYYIPFSSPKKTDYIIKENGDKSIRKSIIPIVRMTVKDHKTGGIELKGTLKLSNMIPVPKSELIPYTIATENDYFYKDLVEKEYSFIKTHKDLILKNADIIYNQKTNTDKIFHNKPIPHYITQTVDFKYAELKYVEFCKQHNLTLPLSPAQKTNSITEYCNNRYKGKIKSKHNDIDL